MKRNSLIILTTLVMALLVTVYGKTTKTKNLPEPSVEPSAQAARRKGTALVNQLPANIEGVELKGNQVRLKEGYKFVNGPNKTMAVARIKGGGNIGGSWNCACSKDGNCGVSVGDNGLDCLMESCKGSCTLKVTIGDKATSIMMFAASR
jgi:hypothetical protein